MSPTKTDKSQNINKKQKNKITIKPSTNIPEKLNQTNWSPIKHDTPTRPGRAPTKNQKVAKIYRKTDMKQIYLLIFTSVGSNLGGMLIDGLWIRRYKWVQQ